MKPTRKTLTKKERKAQRRKELESRGVTPPSNQPKAPKLNPNAGWKEIEDIHKTIVKALENINGLLEYVKDPVVRAHMDRELFMVDWKIAEHDINTHFNPRLIDLAKRTRTLKETGQPIEEILGDFTNIFFEYHKLAEDMEAIMSPTQYALMDNVNQAVNKIKAKVAQAQSEQSVEVVTDVAFKEIEEKEVKEAKDE